MKVGDLIVIDPYWRCENGYYGLDPTVREGQKGIVLGFMATWKGYKKVVVHLFNESQEYFYYSPQHIRPYELPDYTPRRKDESWR